MSKDDLTALVIKIFFRLDIRKSQLEVRDRVQFALDEMQMELEADEEMIRKLEEQDTERMSVLDSVYERCSALNEHLQKGNHL